MVRGALAFRPRACQSSLRISPSRGFPAAVHRPARRASGRAHTRAAMGVEANSRPSPTPIARLSEASSQPPEPGSVYNPHAGTHPIPATPHPPHRPSSCASAPTPAASPCTSSRSRSSASPASGSHSPAPYPVGRPAAAPLPRTSSRALPESTLPGRGDGMGSG